MITFSPPTTAARRQPRDVTFVLDVSGSMSGQKLAQGKAAGRQLLGTLSSGDRVRLVAFASDVREWRDGFAPATAANLRDAEAWLDALQATGGTNIGAALETVLSDAPAADGAIPFVLFVTDGAPSVGQQDPAALAALARARRGARRMFTFGVGADVNATLVEQLAVEGRGTAQFVRPNESVERAVGVTAARLTAPVVTDLRVRADGVRLTHLQPQGPTDVFAGQDAVLLAQVEGSGAATLVFTGRGPDGPVEWRETVQVPVRESGNAFVGKLWATQRVGWLSAERRAHGASAEVDAELRALGERWGIPTELTSYLVREPGTVAPMLSSPAPAAASGAVAFEQARRASVLREATVLDATGASSGDSVRTAGAWQLVRRDGEWRDVRLARQDPRRVVAVQAYSPAWFALTEALPALAPAFAAGDRVRVAGRAVVVVVAPDGVATLTPDAVRRVVRDW
jgi:Ca-activated chloride channel family protein